MDMISIAVFARSFLKELEESTSGRGREPALPLEHQRPAARPTPRPGARARVGAVLSAVRCWLRSPPCRLAE